MIWRLLIGVDLKQPLAILMASFDMLSKFFKSVLLAELYTMHP